jgi:hypothetical protein
MTSNQPHSPGAVTIPPGQVTPLLAALGEAAESRRDQTATCADCADQSCATCQWRLGAADAYDQVAAEMIQAAETSATQPMTSHAAPASGGQRSAADREAGQ